MKTEGNNGISSLENTQQKCPLKMGQIIFST